MLTFPDVTVMWEDLNLGVDMEAKEDKEEGKGHPVPELAVACCLLGLQVTFGEQEDGLLHSLHSNYNIANSKLSNVMSQSVSARNKANNSTLLFFFESIYYKQTMGSNRSVVL